MTGLDGQVKTIAHALGIPEQDAETMLTLAIDSAVAAYVRNGDWVLNPVSQGANLTMEQGREGRIRRVREWVKQLESL